MSLGEHAHIQAIGFIELMIFNGWKEAKLWRWSYGNYKSTFWFPLSH